MAWSKTTAVISNNISLTAGGGPTTTSSQNTTTTGVKHVYIKLTNGSTGPSTPASATVQTSADDSNFYDFHTFTGGTGGNEVKSVSFQLQAPIEYFRIMWTHGNSGDDITARAEFSQIAEVAEAHTSTSDAAVKAGDTVNNAVRVNAVTGNVQADKSTFTEGTTTFTPVGGVFNDTISANPTEDQAAAARITPFRAIHANLRQATGGELAVAFNAMTPSAGVGAGHSDGANMQMARVFDLDTSPGTQYILGTSLRKSGSGGSVELGTALDPVVVTGSATAGTPATGVITVQAPAAGGIWYTSTCVGNVAHDGVDSGNPVKVGGQARTTNPTAVANADRTNAIFDKIGRLITVPGHCRELINRNHITITASTAETTLLAGAAGVFHDLVSLVLVNTSATGTVVSIRDATGGTVRLSFYLAANSNEIYNIAYLLPQTTAANNWTAQCGTSVTDVQIAIVAIVNI